MTRGIVVAASVAMIIVAGVAAGGLSAPQQSNSTTGSTTLSQSVTVPGNESNCSPDYPPGASERGIENATRLVLAHQAALENTSYAVDSKWAEITRVSTPNGTFRGVEVRPFAVTVKNGTNGTLVHIDEVNVSNTYWWTEDALMGNFSSQPFETNIYTYYSTNKSRSELERQIRSFSSLPTQLVYPYIRVLEYEFAGKTTRNNRTLYTYTSTRINETVEANGSTPIRSTTKDINATVVVSDRGTIHSFTVRETHAFANETVTIEQNYTVSGLGETNTVAPTWVTDQLAQFTASFTANGSVIALTHRGGTPVTDPELTFLSPNLSSITTVGETIEAGDTVYLYVTTDGGSNQTLHTRVNEPPSVNSSFVPLDGMNLSVSARRTVSGAFDSGLLIEVELHERRLRNGSNSSTDYPPGASERGIENVTRLVQAHQAALENTTYVVQSAWADVIQTSPADDPSSRLRVDNSTMTVEKGANGAEIRDGDLATFWVTENATSLRFRWPHPINATDYTYSRGPDLYNQVGQLIVAGRTDLLNVYLQVLDWEHVNTTTRHDRTVHTYSSTGINETAAEIIVGSPIEPTTDSINATVAVSDRGLIQSFTARESHSVENESVTVTQSYTVEGIGETNTTVPAWVAEELAQFEISLVANGSVVALTHRGGISVAAPIVEFQTLTETYYTRANGTVEAGDTLYLYVTTDGETNQTLHASINDYPPVNASFAALEADALSLRAQKSVPGVIENLFSLTVRLHEQDTCETPTNDSRTVHSGA